MADQWWYPGGLTDADFADGNSGAGYNPQNFAYGAKVPIGVTGNATALRIRGDGDGGGTRAVKIALFDSGGTLLVDSTATLPSSGIVWVDSGAISQAVSSGDYYVLVSASSSAARYGYDNSGNGLGETVAYASFPPASISTTEDETGTRFGVAVFVEETAAGQSLRPDAVEDAASWTANSGTIATATADESDATYATSDTAPSNSECIVTLSNPSGTPDAGTITLKYRAQKVTGTQQIDLTMGVYEGGNLVEAFTETNLSGTLTAYSHDLTSPSISDYDALKVRSKANQSGSSPPTNPSVRGIGTTASGTTSVAFTGGQIPSNAEGDLIFIVLESCDSSTAAGTPANITDWTKVLADTTSGGGATGVTTLTVYARFVPAGGISGTVTVSGIGNHGQGFMLAVQDHGCTALGDLVVGSVTDHGTSTSSVNIASINVTANSLIIGVHGLSDDASDTNNFTAGPTNANLAGITKIADQTVTTGVGGGTAVWRATCAGTSTGTTAWAHDTAERAQSLHIGIKPIAALTDAAARVTRIELLVPEASTGPELKTGSESPALSVTESQASFLTSSRSDTPSLAVTESRAIEVESDRSDSPALAVTEGAAVTVDLGVVVDAPALAVGEVSALFIAAVVAVSDEPALAVTDTVTELFSASERSDAPALAVTESASIFAEVVASDEPALSVDEVSAVLGPTPEVEASDEPALAVTESVTAIAVFSELSDAPALALVESSSNLLRSVLADAPTISITELAALLRQSARSDTPTLSVTESASVAITVHKTASDDVAFGVVESAEPPVNLGRWIPAAPQGGGWGQDEPQQGSWSVDGSAQSSWNGQSSAQSQWSKDGPLTTDWSE